MTIVKLTNVTEPRSKLLFGSEKAWSARHQGDFFFVEEQIAHLLSSLAALFKQLCAAIFEIGEKIKRGGSLSGFWKTLFRKTLFPRCFLKPAWMTFDADFLEFFMSVVCDRSKNSLEMLVVVLHFLFKFVQLH